MRLLSQTVGSGLDSQHGCILVFLHGDVRALQNVFHLCLSNQRVHLHSTIGCKITVTFLFKILTTVSFVKYNGTSIYDHIYPVYTVRLHQS